jgi:hypothetical protein
MGDPETAEEVFWQIRLQGEVGLREAVGPGDSRSGVSPNAAPVWWVLEDLLGQHGKSFRW